MPERETMDFDAVVVGAGPAGLSCAIRLARLEREAGRDTSICVVEKGSEVGAHILSGAILEPRALDELQPDWRERGAPLDTPVSRERLLLLTRRRAVPVPAPLLPPQTRNHGNYAISLGRLCRWLAGIAEEEGVAVLPGFPAVDLLRGPGGAVAGVITADQGRARDGSEKPGFQPGVGLRARWTIFAEGCRGSLGKRLEAEFGLREGRSHQTYAIGLKELWEVREEAREPGLVLHTAGWPSDARSWAGSFLYHLAGGLVSVGYVVGLDYRNPWRDPFREFQLFKTHPRIRAVLEGGRRIGYGARALNEGGLQSVPRLAFPGGLLAGCEAGFLNVPKIKGTHTAMKTGMLAAEAVSRAIARGADPAGPLDDYEESVRASWVWEELARARNLRPAAARWGLAAGMAYGALDLKLMRGRAPWTLRHREPDHAALRPARSSRRVDYPRPDGVLTFDRDSSLLLAGVNHEADQPVHLRLADPAVPISRNLPEWAEPAARYCPAGVYEVVGEGDEARFEIHAQNCVHCKTCDIKDPSQNITWTAPEGGGGPSYAGM